MLALRTYIIFKLSFWVLLFIPLYFIVDGYRDVYINRRVMIEGKRVEGKIVALKEYSTKKRVYYIYKVAYTIDDSKQYTVTLKKTSKKRSLGDTIFLYYLQDLPHIAKERYNTIYSKDNDAYFILLLIFGTGTYFIVRFFIQK